MGLEQITAVHNQLKIKTYCFGLGIKCSIKQLTTDHKRSNMLSCMIFKVCLTILRHCEVKGSEKCLKSWIIQRRIFTAVKDLSKVATAALL